MTSSLAGCGEHFIGSDARIAVLLAHVDAQASVDEACTLHACLERLIVTP
ncbi:MAG: hypothetical protein Q8L14_36990 [Myxococcales bacterium]|nr:hypothetical protein [Myxococcales bacterium]